MHFNEQPFASMDDEYILDVFAADCPSLFSSFNDFQNLNFSPFTTQDDKFNNDLDINIFYIQSGYLNVPKSKYILFLDPFSLSGNDSPTLHYQV